MKSFIILCCLLTVATAVVDLEWEFFKLQFGRIYENATEDAFRRLIFRSNKLAIDQHNIRFHQKKSTFSLGINEFTDWTHIEFRDMFKTKPHVRLSENTFAAAAALPTSVDWRNSGCVAPAKDQCKCGSCWAFSVIGCAEFYHCRAKGRLVELSPQELIDCTFSYGNIGCDGGVVVSAYQSLIDNSISCETCYAYRCSDAIRACSPCDKCATFTRYVEVGPSGSENAMTAALASVGVLAVAIDAGQPSFQFYKSGVYDEIDCTTSVNHAMLAVGYGEDDGVPYYLVQNSWGTSWGTEGYIKMTRDGSNQCGIATQPSYFVV